MRKSDQSAGGTSAYSSPNASVTVGLRTVSTCPTRASIGNTNQSSPCDATRSINSVVAKWLVSGG